MRVTCDDRLQQAMRTEQDAVTLEYFILTPLRSSEERASVSATVRSFTYPSVTEHRLKLVVPDLPPLQRSLVMRIFFTPALHGC